MLRRCCADGGSAQPVYPLRPAAPVQGVRPFVLEAAYLPTAGVPLQLL